MNARTKTRRWQGVSAALNGWLGPFGKHKAVKDGVIQVRVQRHAPFTFAALRLLTGVAPGAK